MYPMRPMDSIERLSEKSPQKLLQTLIKTDEPQWSEAYKNLARNFETCKSLDLNGFFEKYSPADKRKALEVVFKLLETDSSSVESLSLQNNGIGADSFPIGSERNVAKLKSLDLSRNPAFDVSFLRHRSMQTLSKLSLSGLQTSKLTALAKSFHFFPQLRELSLEASTEAAPGIKTLARSLAKGSSLATLRMIILPANDREQWSLSVFTTLMRVFQKGKVSRLDFVSKKFQTSADESNQSLSFPFEDSQSLVQPESYVHSKDIRSEHGAETFPETRLRESKGVSTVDTTAKELRTSSANDDNGSFSLPIKDPQSFSPSACCLQNLPESKGLNPPVIMLQNTPVPQFQFASDHPSTIDKRWILFRPEIGTIQMDCLYSVDQAEEKICFLFSNPSDMASLFGVGRQSSLVQIHPKKTTVIEIRDLSKSSWENAWKDIEKQPTVPTSSRSLGTADEAKSRLKSIAEFGFERFIGQLLKRHRAHWQAILFESSTDVCKTSDVAKTPEELICFRNDSNISRQGTQAGLAEIDDAKDTAHSTFTSNAEEGPVEETNRLLVNLAMNEDRRHYDVQHYDVQHYDAQQMASGFKPSMMVEFINDSLAPQGWSTVMKVELQVDFQVDDVHQTGWYQDSLSLSLECHDQSAVILKDEKIISQLVPESKDSIHPSLCLSDSPDFVLSRRSTGNTMRFRSFLWNHSLTERFENQSKFATDGVRCSSVNIKVKGCWQLLGDDITIHKFIAEKQLRRDAGANTAAKKGTHNNIPCSQFHFLFGTNVRKTLLKQRLRDRSSCVQEISSVGNGSEDINKLHDMGSDIRVCHNFSTRIVHEGLASANQLFTRLPSSV